MPTSYPRARLGVLSAVAVAAALTFAPPSFAGDPPATDSLASQADSAWQAGDLDGSAAQYEKALEEGGLSPKEVVTAYARVGTVKAATGKVEAALSAFRLAAAIDPEFRLPDESGPKAAALYARARGEAQQMGDKLDVKAGVPTDVPASRSFTVVAHLPEGFAPLVDRIGVEVKERISGTNWNTTKPADAEVKIEVPGKVVLAGSTLTITVSALDSHGNKYATSETKLKVGGRISAVPAAVATPSALEDPWADEKKKKRKDDEEEDKKGGFWSSPWPYAIGGAVVTAAVVGVLLAGKSSDSTVTVGAPQWR